MGRKNEKLTPARRQFATFKAKCLGGIIFFRMGDFYETFYEDAEICSEVLDLTLTSHEKANNHIPLVSVHCHAIDGCLKKMLQAGYRVATCERVENRKTAKDVVNRDVVRIITPMPALRSQNRI